MVTGIILDYTSLTLIVCKVDALAAIKNHIQPGFTTLVNFLEKEYLPHTRTDVAASSIRLYTMSGYMD